MRVMMMHKHDASIEDGTHMREGLVEEMGELIGGFARSGKLLDGAGLHQSKYRSPRCAARTPGPRSCRRRLISASSTTS